MEVIKNGKILEFLNVSFLKQEVKYKNSRFDIYFEKETGEKGFTEIKGVTLEENCIVKFPDTPYLRGIKHIHDLLLEKDEGYTVYILFIIQFKNVLYFKPNFNTHLQFVKALQNAHN